MDHATTETLIERARGGDRAASNALLERFRVRLEGLVRARLGPALRQRIDVEDVLQETFLRALRSLERFERGGDTAFFRWLGSIAGNVILEAARQNGREPLLALVEDIPAGGASQSTALAREERFERLQRALDSLAPDHRRVVLLARIERLPMAEVARRMGRSPEAISQLLWRALRKLRDAFGSTASFHLPDRTLEDPGGRNDGT